MRTHESAAISPPAFDDTGRPATALRLVARTVANRVTSANVLPLAYGLALVCGVGDYLTGDEIAFTLVYLAPVALLTWFRNRFHGVLVSALCAGMTAYIQASARVARHEQLKLFHMFWNDGGTFVMFVMFATMLDALRRYVRKETEDKLLAIEQLRHAERLNVIGKLAAGVAHELGTPLNLVLGNAEMIVKDGATSDATRAMARKIMDQVGRMSTIIRQLLTFARKRGASRESTELTSCIRDGVALLRTIARKQDVELTTEVPEATILVRANGVEMAQVLNNLVINAVHATPPGGQVHVTCEVHGEGRQRFAAMVVADTGTGIAPQDLARVFDPFFTTKEVGLGTGLGLSVTYGIVQDCGGRIEVDSRLGEGARFTVLLPLAE